MIVCVDGTCSLLGVFVGFLLVARCLLMVVYCLWFVVCVCSALFVVVCCVLFVVVFCCLCVGLLVACFGICLLFVVCVLFVACCLVYVA